MANGIQAIGHRGRNSSIIGLNNLWKRRYLPTKSPSGIPTSAARINPRTTLEALTIMWFIKFPVSRRLVNGCVRRSSTAPTLGSSAGLLACTAKYSHTTMIIIGSTKPNKAVLINLIPGLQFQFFCSFVERTKIIENFLNFCTFFILKTSSKFAEIVHFIDPNLHSLFPIVIGLRSES